MDGDGRPFVRHREGKPPELTLWRPDPPREGDPIYCCGVRVGTFHGTLPDSASWYIVTVPTAEMPPTLAAHVRQEHARNSPARK
jgi:hypothetical protein